MISLNERLLYVLAILLIIACSVSAISAYSDNGSGVIEQNPDGDNYTSDSDVASEVYYENASASSSNNGSDSHVSLTQHPTAHPVLLLWVALTLVGISSICFKR